jgi:uncharacterized protein YjbI with pentapeptide repeats
MYGATITQADFRGAKLNGVNAYGANLQKADFRPNGSVVADLRNASFVGADLRHANFCGALIDGTTNFTNADTGASSCPP